MITSASRTASANVGGALASGRDESVHGAGGAIEADDGVAGIDQALSHRTAHDAETDERDSAHSGITFSWRSHRRLSIVVVVGTYSSETWPA